MAETGRAGRFRPTDRLRHGRHLDRRVAFRRRVRARVRDRSRRRAHARADDADPYRRRGRRLDPAFRRRALSRRSGLRRRQSRAEVLSPRRAARRHRRQCDGRQAACPTSSRKFSGRSRTSRSTPTRCARRSPSSRESVGDGRAPEEVADGFITIAVENMANAIKKISVQRGYDVTRYALNCFGGAGGQHACLVADALGMTTVLIHPFSSLLSAYGMGLADIRATRQQAIELPFDAKARGGAEARPRRSSARTRRKEVAGQGVPRGKIKVHRARAYPLRRHGYGAGSAPAGAQSTKMTAAFEKAHKAPLRLHRPQQAAGDRGGVGRSGRRRREISRAGARKQRAQSSPRPPGARKFFSGGEMARRRASSRAISSRPGKGRRPRDHHRAAPDRGDRARLAARAHRQEPSRAHARHDAAARSARSAPRPIR